MQPETSINEDRTDSRDAILRSIREHLGVSASRDAVARFSTPPFDCSDAARSSIGATSEPFSLGTLFKDRLEAVGGHCVMACGETDVVSAVSSIVRDLQSRSADARRIALSDSPIVERVIRQAELNVDEVTVTPERQSLFGYDVGITSAQFAVAETGTLVLESDSERHRLVSLVPPIHIAILDEANIRLTLAEALAELPSQAAGMSRTITFITGPSRTGDIELTLTIGVHGPQEIYVIILTAPPPRI